MSSDFSPDQKRYLEGFASGLEAARAACGKLPAGASGEPTGPDAIHIKAQDRVLAEGGTLADQEKFKRELHPFDGYERLKEQARKNEAPKPADNFRWRFYGLFYVAPAQTSYMCRLRIPKAQDAPRAIERMLKGYLAHRASSDETFLAYSRRHEVDALKAMFAAEVGE